MKDYEEPNKEMECAVQMSLSEVASEDPRFLEQDPPPLSEEFPDGTKIFFLGEHAYGVPAQVSATAEDTLSVILAVRSGSSVCVYVTNTGNLVFPVRKGREREVQRNSRC